MWLFLQAVAHCSCEKGRVVAKRGAVVGRLAPHEPHGEYGDRYPFVMSRVAEYGTHVELREKRGIYYKLVMAQHRAAMEK